MRHSIIVSLCLGSALVLSACENTGDGDVQETLKAVNVIDESNLNDLMLSSADPEEAVAYFKKTLIANPERTDIKRGLALSLIRAKRPAEAVAAWELVVASEDATNEDRVGYADALIRAGEWDQAEAQLDAIPPTYETYRRYRLETVFVWNRGPHAVTMRGNILTGPGTAYFIGPKPEKDPKNGSGRPVLPRH